MASFRSGALIAVAALTLAATAVACSDDDDDAPPDASATAPSADVTPQDPAIIDGQTFISVASNYRVEFPVGWSADDNFLYTPENVTDVFFAPEGGAAPVQANVQIRCDRDLGNFTADEYIAARKQVAEGFAISEIAESTVTVAGEPALQLMYDQRPGGETVVSKTDIVFFANGCGWTLALTEDTSEDRSPEFDAMLATFTFID